MKRLIEKIAQMQNPSVVGLDSLLDYIPQHIKDEKFATYGDTFDAAAQSILEYNKAIIDQICDIVPAVKPQAAYYEMYSWQGMWALCETVKYAQEKGMIVIMDGKRNDIGSTMQAYAKAHLGTSTVNGKELSAFGSDMLTVNGYLGSDGVNPLLPICDEQDKGIFVLVKTSNPSSGELQDQKIGDKSIYETMGAMCEQWGSQTENNYGYSRVGAVVGATYPEQLAEMRQKMPHTFFLVPGYGAQGGGANDVAGAFDKNGLGAIVNSSRAILTAWKKAGTDGKDFAEQARKAALAMKEDIMGVVGKITL
ncbi:MAG: orotidine-5'-phosphate decarboxylase [Negativibacillus massiliensis]|uniref:orotidine-5'-phosphate decarboxylase n=2 Tax=Negativibacillus massiliensis TaxID=1871035 RepID=UPI0003375A3D|nr:orotidine-5'-phosphate decarboxylase [Negativibacillus massiliensis]MDY4048298.1 orotidine-5'-phosphate decarboxylase [Negativibacillus massiliensis]CDA77677.1 orotidine 5'-phosphate decarboxylase [Clostridium sp. CAG:242]